jgi:hypothetical protein
MGKLVELEKMKRENQLMTMKGFKIFSTFTIVFSLSFLLL